MIPAPVGARRNTAHRASTHADVEPEVVQAVRVVSRSVAPSTKGEPVAVGSHGDDEVVAYVDRLLARARRQRASDIHLDPHPGGVVVRARIDGVLHPISDVAPALAASVISRIKVMAGIDVTEHRVPQEGRLTRRLPQCTLDLRVVVLPTRHGEACVIRLHDEGRSTLRLAEVGLDGSVLAGYRDATSRTHGVVLVTGPTGAGKTTTCYATLCELISPSRCVVTVEDPVESGLAGANQLQMHVKAGLTFPVAVRAILRADPDVVMVGEIRDKETASIALQAALSGHLVLSTLHTHSAAATPVRLLEMGVAPYLVASALSGVLTQRLARRLCEGCKVAVPASSVRTGAIALAGVHERIDAAPSVTIFAPGGCAMCTGSGYLGRIVLAEFLAMTPELGRLVLERPTVESIACSAARFGVPTLIDDGWKAVLDGRTSAAELGRVLA